MSWLRKINFWGWFLIILIITYSIWNPSGYSYYHMWIGSWDTPLSVKLLVTSVVASFLFVFSIETYRTLRKSGIIAYVIILLVIFWVLWDMEILGFENINTAIYWIQIPIALILTLGSQGTKIYRSMTGRIGVDDPDTGSTE